MWSRLASKADLGFSRWCCLSLVRDCLGMNLEALLQRKAPSAPPFLLRALAAEGCQGCLAARWRENVTRSPNTEVCAPTSRQTRRESFVLNPSVRCWAPTKRKVLLSSMFLTARTENKPKHHYAPTVCHPLNPDPQNTLFQNSIGPIPGAHRKNPSEAHDSNCKSGGKIFFEEAG